ncbi:PAS domain-containing sensor histidine kinase [Spirosoma sp. KCTC 42546]|uniref:sensor histidine kinase n=1 Tax=Spirosoma sp. KCTC 42546 TaxID=2520506 RepID=UPI00115738E3|nr:ATP-binding protein [Spirosoma sp. KCTC 42546]QDK80101.1 PAS domain-containing sensor histidine kinase [Spirosoma sp. KCTC 42546]
MTEVNDEAIFRSIVMESPIPIALLVGRELIITVANEPQLAVWGKGDKVIGLPLARAIPEMEGQPFLGILDDVFTTGIPFASNNTPATMVVDGITKTVCFDFSFKPIRNHQGVVYGIIATGIEITQQVADRQALQHSEERYRQLSADLDQQVQERTQQLEDSVQDLKRSNVNLQQFAYIASHDLQEPLRKVQQFGDLLKTQFGSELGEGITYIERMQSAANRMSTLIRDLLSFSRISTQRDTSRMVSLTEIVRSAEKNLDWVIDETNAVVHVSDLPMVEGDPSQLEQLFQNLLSNALKFHKPGVTPQVHILYEWVASSSVPKAVKSDRKGIAYHRIDVIDDGIGFEEKYLDRIFTVFQRLHSKSEFDGTGIGLAICDKVVANHGGAIIARSQPGQGSIFSVFLPIY